jgi:uncharacterized protein DUF1707
VGDRYRVSDAEREQTVLSLRDHLLAGRLTLDEFSERAETAYSARIGRDLARVQEDLPEIDSGRARSPRKPARLTSALFAHVVRRGRFRVGRWTFVIGAFADVDLDLREAEMDGPTTAVTVLAAFANVDVYVPDGLNVDVGGLTIFGHRRDRGLDVARPDAPTIHVRVLACFGTVDVWRVPKHMQGSYSEIFHQFKAQVGRLFT